MSLTVDIRINDERIGLVEITRIGDKGSDPDSVRDDQNWAVVRTSHRYGDGALALAHKVLGEIVERHFLANVAGDDA